MIYIVLLKLIVLSVVISLIIVRKRQYKYNPAQDYVYDFETRANAIYASKIHNHSLQLFEKQEGETLILKMDIHPQFLGHFFQPYVEVTSENGKKERSYLEHRARGIRYIDASRFVADEACSIRIEAHYCTIDPEVVMYQFKNEGIEEKVLLTLAPHPDDAEIAAFGLYSSVKESYIVTTTVGEEGKCDYCGLVDSKQDKAIQKGKLRAHDAITVPMLGNISQHRCAMLGYFGMSLKWMFDHRDEHAVSKVTGIDDINYFRRVEHTGLIKNEHLSASWESLVRDLYSAIIAIKPDIIVTPHPEIDGNSDHRYTTYALIEALKQANMNTIKLYGYTNHHIYNEAYPYGPIFSTSALAPKFDIPFKCDAIYSHRLDQTKQYEKFYALEAMHDLRDATLVIGVKKAWRHFTKQLKRAVQQRDKSYYRRAVRPNELFYVMEWRGLDTQ
jgi:LmbE family N-acetylglucosaminyl deacetylase